MCKKIPYDRLDEKVPFRMTKGKIGKHLKMIHSHLDFSELYLVISGEMLQVVNDKEYLFKKNDLFYINSNDRHMTKQAEDEMCEFLIFYVKDDLKNKIKNLFGNGFFNRFERAEQVIRKRLEISEMQNVLYMMDNISESLLFDVTLANWQYQSLVSNLFVFLQRKQQNENDIPIWLENLLYNLNHQNNFLKGTDYLFEKSTRSKEHTSRSFRKYLGLSPSMYINRQKINYAKRLLGYSNLSVTRIALDSYFSSISRFYACFKEQVGLSPVAYRKVFKKKFIS